VTKIIVGCDEAGRGPVLGPLVMVAVAVKEENEKKLQWLGVKDSKLLSSSVREELFERIHELVEDFRVEVVEPDAIDLSLNQPESNLNWLEADTSARMVSEMHADKIIIDCPSVNIDAYREYFKSKLSKGVADNTELIVEHKADMNYIVVAAASVVAKVIRDRWVDRLKQEIKVDFGSLPYYEKVLIRHKGITQLRMIGEVIEEGLDNIEVFSLDPEDYQIKPFAVTRFIEHPKTDLFRLYLERGKFVDLSDNHPLFVLNEKGSIVPKQLKHIVEGEYICLSGGLSSNGKLNKLSLLKQLIKYSNVKSPILVEGETVIKIFQRNELKEIQKLLLSFDYSRTSVYHWRKTNTLPLPVFDYFSKSSDCHFNDFLKSNKGNETRIPLILNLDENLMWLLGMYVAEGSLSRDKVIISSKDESVYERVRTIAQKYRINTYREKCNIGLSSIIFTKIIKSLDLGAYAREKTVPDILYSCSNDLINSFLDGLYEGDGYNCNGTWEIEIYSVKLAENIQWLNLYLDNFTSYRKRSNRDGNMVNILAKNTNSLSPDNFPSIIGMLIRKIRLDGDISLSMLSNATGIAKAHLSRIERGKVKSIQKRSLQRISQKLGNPVDLNKLINSNLCWLKVKNVQKLNKKEKVFDFEVKPEGRKIENFLGGSCGILLHNSGYMSDPKTKVFLDNYYDKHPKLFRKSWKSYKNAKIKSEQKSLGEF